MTPPSEAAKTAAENVAMALYPTYSPLSPNLHARKRVSNTAEPIIQTAIDSTLAADAETIARLSETQRHMNLARSEAGCPDDETLIIHCRELRADVARLTMERDDAKSRMENERQRNIAFVNKLSELCTERDALREQFELMSAVKEPAHEMAIKLMWLYMQQRDSLRATLVMAQGALSYGWDRHKRVLEAERSKCKGGDHWDFWNFMIEKIVAALAAITEALKS